MPGVVRLDIQHGRRSLRATRGGAVAFVAVILLVLMVPLPARSDDATGTSPSNPGQPSPTEPKGKATPTAAAVASASNRKLSTGANPGQSRDEVQAITGNPGQVNSVTGTGLLGQLLDLDRIPGLFLGGAWVADGNYLVTGGVKPHLWSFNSLVLLNLVLDSDKLVGIPGGSLGVQMLQFAGRQTNQEAGSFQGFNSLVSNPPLDRLELYELWWRQELFDDKLVMRVGKSLPPADFNNVSRPVPTSEYSQEITSVTGLISGTIGKSPTMFGVEPGFYDTAYGITATYAPVRQFYISYGVFDGSIARGIKTGLDVAPNFIGHYINIGEAGYAWVLGEDQKPGAIGAGGWVQTGRLYGGGTSEEGAQGFYMFGSQRVWFQHPGLDPSGISGFLQFAMTPSKTQPANEFLSGGLTAFGLVHARPDDSMGAGIAWSWLNRRFGLRSNEFMAQMYYQAPIFDGVFLQPALTYTPNPGNSPGIPGSLALTSRITVLF
jgi:porin